MMSNSIYHQSKSLLHEEEKWISDAKRDPERFGPLYKKYYEQIFRYVYQRMDDQDLAFDVTSQVFIKALHNIHKFEYRGVPFSSWLYRIAKSELYQAYRDRNAKRTVNIDTMQIQEFIQEFDEEHSEKNKNRLLKALKKLKEEDLQLIELRYFEQRSYREIGDILEIKENNAKVKSFRALEKLKKIF